MMETAKASVMFIEDEARTKNFFARKRATLRRCLSSLWVARLCDRLVVAIMGAPLVVMVRAYAQSYQPCVGPLSFAQTILSDREQQLTLIRTVYAALFVVCLLFVWSLRPLHAHFLKSTLPLGVGQKSPGLDAAKGPAQFFYKIPQPQIL
jgi:hypothetical protein